MRTIGDRLLVRVTKKADETRVGARALSAEAAASAKVSEGVVLKAGAGRLGSSGKTGPMPVKVDQYVKRARAVFARARVHSRASARPPGRLIAARRPAPPRALFVGARARARALDRYRDYAGNAVSVESEDLVVCRASDCLSMWEGDTLASALPAP